jgi:iron complex transport system substrate-binding protein
MAGGENVAAKAVAPWVQFSIEQLVNADPEVIILPAKHGTAFTMPQELQGHPAWRQTTAVKQGRIHTIDSDLVDRSGPRIVQGLEEIAKILHPELFE